LSEDDQKGEISPSSSDLPMKKVIIKVVVAEVLCPKCITALTIVARVAKKTNSEIEQIDAFSTEAKSLRVLVVPSIYVNDKLVAAGDIISEGEIEEFVRKLMLSEEPTP
jgi:alkyl hydroperoxide reductase subunit AhpF